MGEHVYQFADCPSCGGEMVRRGRRNEDGFVYWWHCPRCKVNSPEYDTIADTIVKGFRWADAEKERRQK